MEHPARLNSKTAEMSSEANERVRWIPFWAMTITLVIVTGFWKINKNLQEPLQPIEAYQSENQQQPPPSKIEGKLAPDFTLPTMDGKAMTLADYRGKVVFLNIWATWCPPCREEMPSMQNLHEKFKGKDFAMLTISIDEDTELVRPFMEELGLTFPVAFDPEQTVASQYGITGVPETFLIDKNGVVMHHIVGPGKWDDPSIITAFERLVSRPMAPVTQMYQNQGDGETGG